MNVLHLAAGNRWTGTAATAFAEAEALRAAGVDAHYAYVGGYKLEAKIGRLAWVHPLVEREQNPWSFLRTATALRRFIERERIDVVHAHLTWDHSLARVATRGGRATMARTFHSRRVLRTDPWTRSLVARTRHLMIVNDAFRDAPAVRGRGALFTPPPLDLRQFTAQGPSARSLYGIDAGIVVAGAIGKLSPGRGFEDVLRSFAALRASVSGARLLIIGHGPHRPALETLTASLGIEGAVVWAGYHEDDLADHYRACDVLLFTARGSDEGHRAVIEAQGCGVPVAAYPIEGIQALLPARGVSAAASPDALAVAAATLLSSEREPLRREAVSKADEFGYAPAAARLIAGYSA